MIIKNGLIFQKEGSFKQGDLHIQEEYIVKQEKNIKDENVIDAEGLYVIPGLIDIHFHGCVGYDFCDGTSEALEKIATYQGKNGVLAICPASMTFPEERLAAIFENAANYQGEEGATLVGINMEGPFISMGKKGAQNGTFIHKPDVEMFLRLQEKAKGMIKLVDIAPEIEGAMAFIEEVGEKVTVSLAHTTADYDTSMKAFEKGAKHVSHLYNAMPAYSHRAPGVIGAACDEEKVMVELITDGIHSHPAVVRTTFKMFGDDRIVLISDSMMACGLQDGQYELGGQAVTVRGHLATLTEGGAIAGSVTNLMDCIRNAVQNMGVPLASTVKCATVNPANAIGISEYYGSLEEGKLANIVLLNKDLEICSIIKEGKIFKS